VSGRRPARSSPASAGRSRGAVACFVGTTACGGSPRRSARQPTTVAKDADDRPGRSRRRSARRRRGSRRAPPRVGGNRRRGPRPGPTAPVKMAGPTRRRTGHPAMSALCVPGVRFAASPEARGRRVLSGCRWVTCGDRGRWEWPHLASRQLVTAPPRVCGSSSEGPAVQALKISNWAKAPKRGSPHTRHEPTHPATHQHGSATNHHGDGRGTRPASPPATPRRPPRTRVVGREVPPPRCGRRL
jgi:hypothetical protein